MKKIYLTLMIISLVFILFITMINIKPKSIEKKEDNIKYNDLEIVKEFNNYNYDASVTYYKKQKENPKSDYSLIRYTYKDSTEKFNDMSNNLYEYDDFNNKEKYTKTNDQNGNEIFKKETISYESYHSMILEVLNNSKYNGDATILLKTPKNIIKNFIEKFNARANSSIKYDDNQDYKLYIKINNNQITEFILIIDENKHISFTFTNINQIEDIRLPSIEGASE